MSSLNMSIRLASVSGHSLRLTFKICQIVSAQAISMIRYDFTNFLNLIFGGFSLFAPTVEVNFAEQDFFSYLEVNLDSGGGLGQVA